MVLEYFSKNKKGKQPAAPPVVTTTAPPTDVAHAEGDAKSPVLTKEDEDFFKRIIAEDHQSATGGQLVIFDKKDEASSTDAQVRLMDGADGLPLPSSPLENESANPLEATQEPQKLQDAKDSARPKDPARRKSYLAAIQRRLPFSRDAQRDAARKQAGDHLADVAGAVKAGESLAPPTAAEEEEKEKKDLTAILDQLNLSALNNRAFSFSEESQKLMAEFTQILKDLINGVPTAYDDLEKLLTKSDKSLKQTFKNLPPFIQKFIKTLPTKLSATVAPGLLAAASEKPGADGAAMGMSTASTSSKYLKQIPGLKSLISTEAIVGMLRTILNFLKLRFPAVISGTNILLSLAVFLLLFVFWYCHKRGRETRLERERLQTEGATSGAASSAASVSTLEESTTLPEEPGTAALRHNADAEKLQRILDASNPPKQPLPPADGKPSDK